MGYGIDELSLSDIINQIILPGPHHKTENVCTFVPATLAVVWRLFSEKRTIASFVNKNSIDKQRADNVTNKQRSSLYQIKQLCLLVA
eukprot:887390-Ditylum_brightwellii.AAC.1